MPSPFQWPCKRKPRRKISTRLAHTRMFVRAWNTRRRTSAKGQVRQQCGAAHSKYVGELLTRRRRAAIQSTAVDGQFQIKVIQCLHCSHDQKKCHRTSTLIRFLWLFKAVLPWICNEICQATTTLVQGRQVAVHKLCRLTRGGVKNCRFYTVKRRL